MVVLAFEEKYFHGNSIPIENAEENKIFGNFRTTLGIFQKHINTIIYEKRV